MMDALQMTRSIYRLLALALTATAAACAPASQHAADVARAQEAGSRVTVGTVQREIRVGMTNAQVIEVLGSPNVVTTDDRRRETWVYDRISTQTAYSGSSGGVSALFLAGVGSGAGAVSTSQRTLTIIIRYDETGRVRDFAYRSSSF
jgi:outer membrane protein assembly factor BamE (lipoprotein component of BamABCDE complex)